MQTHTDKNPEKQSTPAAAKPRYRQHTPAVEFVDNRPEAILQRKLQEMANNSPQAKQAAEWQAIANNSPQAKQAAEWQAIANNHAMQQHPIQKKENKTGLPDTLKTGIEHLSGIAMDDVKVYYNSAKPAQLQALAYAQGTHIHLAPGQEKHLPHEAWHVVQQKQGRVQPTLQMKGGVNVNDNAGLEKEADMMGAKDFQFADKRPEAVGQRKLQDLANNSLQIAQLQTMSVTNNTVLQAMMMTTPINTLNTQPTSMSCWAACIAAITHRNVHDIIAENIAHWAYNGLPPDRDFEILSEKYNLMKFLPWHHGFAIEGKKGMVANHHHWIVVHGIQKDEHGLIEYYKTWDPEYEQIANYTFHEMNNWGAQVAYCV